MDFRMLCPAPSAEDFRRLYFFFSPPKHSALSPRRHAGSGVVLTNCGAEWDPLKRHEYHLLLHFAAKCPAVGFPSFLRASSTPLSMATQVAKGVQVRSCDAGQGLLFPPPPPRALRRYGVNTFPSFPFFSSLPPLSFNLLGDLARKISFVRTGTPTRERSSGTSWISIKCVALRQQCSLGSCNPRPSVRWSAFVCQEGA
eukprot:scaffold48_cov311-Pinguiococcus_pyrenoidosus.AAC.103